MASAALKVVKSLSGLRKKARKSPLGKIAEKAKELSPAKIGDKLMKEQKISKQLHADVQATLKRMTERDEGLKKAVEDAYGYAVFPSIGRASLLLGISFGKGEVFKQGKLIGYAGAVQLTLGVQVGGQTYGELVLFQNKDTLEQFKQSKVGFAANASAVLVKAGGSAANNYKSGMQVFVQPDGGMALDLDIGGQKLIFRPAALTRGKSAETEEEGARASA